MNETLEQKRLAITCCSSSNRPRKPESEAIRYAFFFQSAAQRLSPTLYWTVPRTSAWLPFLSENHRLLQSGIRSNLLHNLRPQRIFAHDGPYYRVREPPVHEATEYLLDC